jgi:hypothetical protein
MDNTDELVIIRTKNNEIVGIEHRQKPRLFRVRNLIISLVISSLWWAPKVTAVLRNLF